MTTDAITCPSCGKTETDNHGGWDVLGACEGNVFCTDCHCEFDPDTGTIHRCEFADDLDDSRRRLPHGHNVMTRAPTLFDSIGDATARRKTKGRSRKKGGAK